MKAFVATTLDLTPAEAKKFWPIYDAYQRAIEASNRKRALVVEAVVAKDEDLSNAYAKNLATEAIANDEAEIRARRALQNRLMKALPPIKAARYLQLESKIRAVQDYDIASANAPGGCRWCRRTATPRSAFLLPMARDASLR